MESLTTKVRTNTTVAAIAVIAAVAVVAGASVVGAVIDASRNWNSCWWDE